MARLRAALLVDRVDRAPLEERALLVEDRALLAEERPPPDERPVLLERELLAERPVLLDRELVVRRRPEPPLELDPDPPLLACGMFPP
ncbi:MAG: hypothetical protein ACJ764_13700 [Solirubrobacteraceae bacterium]